MTKKQSYWDGIATMGVICLVLVIVSSVMVMRNVELMQENIRLNDALTEGALK